MQCYSKLRKLIRENFSQNPFFLSQLIKLAWKQGNTSVFFIDLSSLQKVSSFFKQAIQVF